MKVFVGGPVLGARALLESQISRTGNGVLRRLGFHSMLALAETFPRAATPMRHALEVLL